MLQFYHLVHSLRTLQTKLTPCTLSYLFAIPQAMGYVPERFQSLYICASSENYEFNFRIFSMEKRLLLTLIIKS